MSKKSILASALQKLNAAPCPIHNITPTIEAKANNSFEVKYCCEQYAQKVQKRLDALVIKEVDLSIKAIFKKKF